MVNKVVDELNNDVKEFIRVVIKLLIIIFFMFVGNSLVINVGKVWLVFL